jgi:predicted SAM-dependent methyltransferase
MFFHISDQELMPVGVTFDRITNLDNYDNDSIDSIIIQDLLDYYIIEEDYRVLYKLYEKLKPGGKIEIQSIDIKKLCIAIAFNEINENFVQHILYPYKQSIHSINQIQSFLNKIGFSIEVKKYVNALEYYFIAIK